MRLANERKKKKGCWKWNDKEKCMAIVNILKLNSHPLLGCSVMSRHTSP